MRIGLSGKTIAKTMEENVFSFPLSSMMGPARDVVSLVTSSQYTDRRLFNMMHAYISNKVVNYGGKLSALFVKVDGKNKKIDYTNCDSLMRNVVKNDSELTVKVMIKNKYYEFVLKNGGE